MQAHVIYPQTINNTTALLCKHVRSYIFKQLFMQRSTRSRPDEMYSLDEVLKRHWPFLVCFRTQHCWTVALLSNDVYSSQWWSDTNKHKTTTITMHFCIIKEITPKGPWLVRDSLSSWFQIYRWSTHMSGLPGAFARNQSLKHHWLTSLVRETVFPSHLRQQWAENKYFLYFNI